MHCIIIKEKRVAVSIFIDCKPTLFALQKYGDKIQYLYSTQNVMLSPAKMSMPTNSFIFLEYSESLKKRKKISLIE